MVFVLISGGIVEHCIAVNSIDELREFYPDHLILEQVGAENVGWSFDGSEFIPPKD